MIHFLTPTNAQQLHSSSRLSRVNMNATWLLFIISIGLSYQNEHVRVVRVPLELKGLQDFDVDVTQVREKSLSKLSKIKLPIVSLPVRQIAPNQTVCDDQCGVPFMGRAEENRIVGGRQTGPNQFPWVVQILIRVPDFFRYQIYRCGASLIKDRYLLTAAHCVYYAKLSAVALIGHHYVDPQRPEVNVTGFEQRINVTNAFIPLDFDPPTMTSDIAVLELERPVRYNKRVHTICLPPSDFPDNQLEQSHSPVVVAGWGYMPFMGANFVPFNLQYASTNLMDWRQCRTIPTHKEFVSERVLCTRSPGRDVCKGDSGGPLMYTKDQTTPRYTVIGVVSWGEEHCDQTKTSASVYVRVSRYAQWIQNVTSGTDSCLPFSQF